jgi:hypothetical protein
VIFYKVVKKCTNIHQPASRFASTASFKLTFVWQSFVFGALFQNQAQKRKGHKKRQQLRYCH